MMALALEIEITDLRYKSNNISIFQIGRFWIDVDFYIIEALYISNSDKNKIQAQTNSHDLIKLLEVL